VAWWAASARGTAVVAGRSTRSLGIDMLTFSPALTEEVLEYLLLEYGESTDDPDALKIGDLTYMGQFQHHGVATHFWEYPTSRGKRWAIVYPMEGTYCTSTCSVAPGSEPDTPLKNWWRRLWGGVDA
jgi:hypothetical protein